MDVIRALVGQIDDVIRRIDRRVGLDDVRHAPVGFEKILVGPLAPLEDVVVGGLAFLDHRQRVVAGAAIDDVAAGTADQIVVAAASRKRIISGQSEYVVVAGATGEGVDAIDPGDRDVAAVAEERVGSGSTAEIVGAGTTDERVAAAREPDAGPAEQRSAKVTVGADDPVVAGGTVSHWHREEFVKRPGVRGLLRQLERAGEKAPDNAGFQRLFPRGVELDQRVFATR